MNHSFCLDELTKSQRLTFDELGIEPKDRVYIRALKKVSNEALATAYALNSEFGLDEQRSTLALAEAFDRHPKTISNRLRRLGTPPVATDTVPPPATPLAAGSK